MSDPNIAVASSAISLAKSLIDFVPASGSLINVSRETYNWLIRERIDEGSFERCRQMALGLAYPNDAGMDIQRQIEEGDRKIIDRLRQVPVRLIVSGSIGRLLAKDVDTCYLVSTVAALTRFHDLEFATDAICSMILDRGGHEKEVSLKYNVQRSPVKAVISKIVDSIYLNVVNAGHDLGGLPAELKHLHSHLLDDRSFAGIVMGIERSEHNVVIRSDRFLSDLTLWLLLHFQGRIVVSVDKTVLYEKTLGPSSRVVRIMVKELCPEDAQSCLKVDAPVEALISVGDELFTFLTGTDDNDFHPCSYTRQAFYDVEDLTSRPRSAKLKLLNHAECNSIVNVAKVMMDWLLNVSIVPAPDLLGLTFRVLLEPEEESALTIGDLLQNHPGLHNLNTGLFPKPEPILRRPDEESSDPFSDEDAFTDTSPTKPSSIFEWFPIAQTLLEQIQPRCSCSACKSEAKLDLCKRGCLREAAVTRLFVLLAHGICDAFGAKDVSGRANSEDQVTGITTLLLEILHQQLVRWDTWFELVACTTAGISWDAFDSVGDDGCSSWAAIQFGSFLAVAPWLDLAKEAKVKGCFGITPIEGNLQGVPDDAGLVRCEMDQYNETYQPLSDFLHTEPSANESHRIQFEKACEDSDTIEAATQLDTVKVEIYTAIFRTDQFLYRLMTTGSPMYHQYHCMFFGVGANQSTEETDGINPSRKQEQEQEYATQAIVMATLRFYHCLMVLAFCRNHAIASPPPLRPISPSLSNRSPNPNPHPLEIFPIIPHEEPPIIEPGFSPSTPHPFAPAASHLALDPAPAPKPEEPKKPGHDDRPDLSSLLAPTSTPTPSSSGGALLPASPTTLPAEVVVGNTTITAGSPTVVVSGHSVALLASSVLVVDNSTTTLVSPNTGSPSATVIAGLTVQPVLVTGTTTASATTDGGSGQTSTASSSAGPQVASGGVRLSALVPRTLIYGYGACVLAFLLAQATAHIIR